MVDLSDLDFLRLIHDRVADLTKIIERTHERLDALDARFEELAMQSLEVDAEGKTIPPMAFIEKGEDNVRYVERVPAGASPGYCRDCNARIYWVRNARFPNNDRGGPNLLMFNGDGSCHIDTCKVKSQARASSPQGAARATSPSSQHASSEAADDTGFDTDVPF